MTDKNAIAISGFKVIGIGFRTHSILLKTIINYPRVRIMLLRGEITTPKDHDEMVLFVNPENRDITSITKAFHEANVLTLIISTKKIPDDKESFDSCAIVSEDEIFSTIKGILDPIFHKGPISYDFNDICQTLKDSEKFMVKSFIMDKEDVSVGMQFENLMLELKEYQNIKNISIILNANNKSVDPLLNSEMEKIQSLLNSLPENVNLIWGIHNDESLKENQIKVSIIISGKL